MAVRHSCNIALIILLASIHLALAQTGGSCASGYYGYPNCTMCHCLSAGACADTGCTDYQCDRGFMNPPQCQTVCVVGTFGSNCVGLCHCLPTDTSCSALNGVCFPSYQCDPHWSGPGCQTRLPQLVLSPMIVNVTCTQLYVTWNPWNYFTDIGTQSSSILSYTLEERINASIVDGSAGWNSLGDVIATNQTSLYGQLVTIVDPYSYIEFKIIVNLDDYGRPLRGPPSPPSTLVRPIVLCTEFLQAATTEETTSYATTAAETTTSATTAAPPTATTTTPTTLLSQQSTTTTPTRSTTIGVTTTNSTATIYGLNMTNPQTKHPFPNTTNTTPIANSISVFLMALLAIVCIARLLF